MDYGLWLGLAFVVFAALFFAGGMLWSWYLNRKERLPEDADMKECRDKAIGKALFNPSSENVEWMWKKIDDYDNRDTGA